MSHKINHLYEFGLFRLDAGERLLLRDGESVPLTPKAFDLLLALVERHGRLTEKNELLKLVWPDTFVEEANLSYNISLIRKALGDGENGQKLIETVPKRGYRFVAVVREIRDESASEPGQIKSAISCVTESNDDGALRQATSDAAMPGKAINRHWRKAALLLAAAVFVAAVAFYLNRAPILTEKDTVLLADFDNRTGDDIFDGMLKQALAVQLEQSPFLNIFAEERVREALKLMSRSPDERVTREIAREICQRQGLKALLLGSIAKLDHHYAITLETINGQTGETIARQQTEAEGKDQVLKTLDSAATKLREQLGESLSSIQKFDAPIEQATTSSLAAFKAYSLGNEQRDRGQFLKAIPFYHQALELDAEFALAYAKLGLSYYNTSQSQFRECAEKAFARRERVSERERYLITNFYYANHTLETDKAIAVLELWKRTYPRDFFAHMNLGYRYLEIGQCENALAEAKEAIQLHPNYANNYLLLSGALTSLNRFAEARQVYEEAFARNLQPVRAYENLFLIAFAVADTPAMQRNLATLKDTRNGFRAFSLQAQAAAFSGQLRQARALSNQTFDAMQGSYQKERAPGVLLRLAEWEALIGNCGRVREDITRLPVSFRNQGDSLLQSANILALCGEAKQAQSLAEEAGKQSLRPWRVNALELPVTRALIEIASRNYAQALQALQPAVPYESASGFWVPWLRGQVYLQLNQPAEASAEFQKIIDHRGWNVTSMLWPLAHLGLARAAAMQGETVKARKLYQDFFTLWKDSDADLPILLAAKQEYEKLG